MKLTLIILACLAITVCIGWLLAGWAGVIAHVVTCLTAVSLLIVVENCRRRE